jgi:hypothetical protein
MDVSKIKDAYASKMSPELKKKFPELTFEEQNAIPKALIRFHQVIEKETFQLLDCTLAAKATEK